MMVATIAKMTTATILVRELFVFFARYYMYFVACCTQLQSLFKKRAVHCALVM